MGERKRERETERESESGGCRCAEGSRTWWEVGVELGKVARSQI